MDEGDWKYCAGRGWKERVSCPISDSGDPCMSPECVVLPDVSDSDGHGGPGIQPLPLFPIPPARPFYPCDKTRRRRVSSSATVVLSLTHSLPLKPTFLLNNCVFFFQFLHLISAPPPSPPSTLSFCSLICSLTPFLCLILLFSCPSFGKVLFLQSLE